MRIHDGRDEIEDRAEAGTTGEPQSMAELLAASERADELRPLRRGEVVEGRVSSIQGDEILIDLGQRPAGVASLREADDELRVGDPVMAVVQQTEGPDGHAVLSLRHARREHRWLRLRELERSGEVLEAPVVEANRGGVVVDVGIRGFIPLSQLSSVRAVDRPADPVAAPEALKTLVGRRLQLKVVEADPKRNRLILSEKAAAQAIRRQRKARAAAEVNQGDQLDGTVTQVAGFGLFVDFGPAEGLVHRSEVTWDKTADPLTVYHVGDKVRVKVTAVDRERDRISLSIKQTQEDPWARVGDELTIGQDRDATITRVVPFGAFARVADGLEGLIHVSELASQRTEDPSDVVSVGDRVRVRVVGVDPERRRISLSIRQVDL